MGKKSTYFREKDPEERKKKRRKWKERGGIAKAEGKKEDLRKKKAKKDKNRWRIFLIIIELLAFPGYCLKILLIFIIRWYKKYLSPFLPPLCRFHPTCSEYFIEALYKKGLVKGFLMGVWRILRCNPFCQGGYDPVEPDPLEMEEKKEYHKRKRKNNG